MDYINKLNESYKKHGNVWKVGKIHNITGQKVHYLLSKRGFINRPNYLIKEDELKILNFYNDGINYKTLKSFAEEIGRTSQFVSRFANKHGLTDRNRKKDISVKKSYSKRNCIVCGAEFIGLVYKTSRKTCSNECQAKLKSLNHKKWHESTNHPRGMLGKTHSKETCDKMSKRMISSWKNKESIFNSEKFKQGQSDRMSKRMINKVKNNPSSVYSRTKKGWVTFSDDKKYYFRSGWEMNYSMYLEFLKKHKSIKDWEYEVDTFWFDKIKRGVRSYTPDFKIFNNDNTIEYHEVKGWMDAKSKTKLSRMRKYYNNVKVKLIDESCYNELKKNSKLFGFIV